MDGLENRDGFSDTGKPSEGPEKTEQRDKVLVLPVNGESRKITQILSNETSLKILDLLGKESMSATGIAEELKLPLTTVKYNLDALVESDLIKIKQIKWSQKGRQVKIYESVDKLIVLVPSKSPMDRLSIISLLQKYLGVIGAAFFAAAGIEYFSAYMQAKRVIDATAPLRMGTMEIPAEPSPEQMAMEMDESSNISPKIALDQQMPESRALNASSGALDTGTGNTSSGLEAGPIQETAEVPVSVPDGLDSVQGVPSIPPEGLTHAGGIHGLYDTLSLHPGIWFLLGCLFIVVLLIVREIYSKKKAR
ncbi:ArsR family transcriptional regulator [Methanosarcina sp. MSH10X1]|uniref:ArsR/SmtB family transcription factor n=1 Tax=Methanosarcina sp. MSH10X1 TaxID=2507075 RepID=UPI000FFB519D|nr:helix-turn-helix domain-containing protein [Methanosarcina sp. MSH10X1]RXA21281.1 ArsR family transcriptional regulator [Methanosarcina sp. MSH10X1]